MSEQKWITITVPCEVRSAGGAGKAGTWTEHDGRKGVWVARSEQEVLIWHEDLHRSIDRAAWPSGSTVDWQDRVLAEALLIPISAQQEERERCAAEIVRYGIPAVAFAIDRAWNEGADASRPEPPRAPLTEEEARIARGLQACAAAWEPDVRLIGNFTAREIGRFASAILSRGEIPPDARPVSASSTAGEWQCVSCHAHETEMHRAWCEIEGAAGTVASRATDAQPVAPPTPDLDALRARREELRAKMAGDGGDRSTSPLVALIRELAEIEAQIEATKEGAK